ncbi:hypothetical protein RKE30_14245 [Streptomyces sp. Li-HN-5-11]|uniref:hypothetical protein n=1 Tax=Streptomyces sp. Li-HN-5-11 TaxID=3075432 RepID=UPI0028A5E4A7|nr:hypothetical protein [Streptomyces sp. Li-HN-5-11]WNM31487.1 hypothetical protein RKE30_14245 [Streptomyces sp. Li-HN-5-11]
MKALGERLAVATVAARLADFDGARAVLGERVRFQQGQRPGTRQESVVTSNSAPRAGKTDALCPALP